MTYPTTDQCITYIDIAGASEDTEIGWIRDGIVAQIEQHTGRVFVSGASTKNFPDRLPYVTRRGRVLSFLDDLVSVTSLTNGNGTVLAASDYDLWPVSGPPYIQAIIRNNSNVRFAVGSDGTRIVLVGSWGYSAACPASIFLVILELVHLSYSARHDGSGMTITAKGSIVDKGLWPPRVLDSLKDYKRL